MLILIVIIVILGAVLLNVGSLWVGLYFGEEALDILVPLLLTNVLYLLLGLGCIDYVSRFLS